MADNVLDMAIRSLTIWDVWHKAGLELPKVEKDTLYESPFRVDRKPSFSVGKGGTIFNDFSVVEHKGGVWNFARLAWPGKSKAETRQALIELAGLESMAEAQDRGAEKPLTEADRKKIAKRRYAERMKRLKERSRAAWTLPDPLGEPSPWPPAVENRWNEGNHRMRGDNRLYRRLCAKRGWPEDWGLALMARDIVSAPIRASADDPAGPRGLAFKVCAPFEGELVPMGYHQYLPFKSAGAVRKAWAYIPNIPKAEPRSRFEAGLIDLGLATPALPMALGRIDAPDVVILEGQWDAITYFGNLGGFLAGNDFPYLVLGLRGASSWHLALRAWQTHLSGRDVTIVPDSDRYGDQWIERPMPGLPCFRDMLEKVSGRVFVKRIPAGMGKDYNDFYIRSMAGSI